MRADSTASLAKQDHQHSITEPQANSPPCRLLSLPPEVRELIWTFTVVLSAKQSVRLKKYPLPAGYYQRIPSTLALACACRKTYLEVAPIYYSRNSFTLSVSHTRILNQSKLRRFITAIGPANTRCISSLRLVISKRTPRIDFTAPVPGFVYLHGNSPVVLELGGGQLPSFCRCVPRRIVNFVVIAKKIAFFNTLSNSFRGISEPLSSLRQSSFIHQSYNFFNSCNIVWQNTRPAMPRIKKSAVITQDPFPVLLLPPELRNHIWRYTVVKEGHVTVQRHFRQELASNLPASRLRSGCELRLHGEDDQRRVASKLAVAFTCRQLYLEVTPIYYRENNFHLPWRAFAHFRVIRNDIKEFAEAIGSEHAASILSVHLRLACFPQHEYLLYFPGLMRLDLTKDQMNEFYRPSLISDMISYVRKHPSLVATLHGEILGLQGWISFAEKNGVVGDW